MTSLDDVISGGKPERDDVPLKTISWASADREITPDIYPCTMSKLLKQGQVGKFAIEKVTISKGTVVDGYDRHRGKIDQINCNFDYTVVKLTENGNTWMSDNPFEVESSMGAVENARGDVLIGGLGIGMLPTLMKDKVDRIDIVELNQEVIDLVFHQVATEKMKIIHGDVIQYLKSTEKRYDFICVDIWPDTFLPMWDIISVKELAQRCLKPGGDIWCWLQELYHAPDDETKL
jgi:hypothetical protein